LKSNPSSRNDGNWGKSHGIDFVGFISKGKVEKDGIGSIIIVPAEEDLFCSGKGNSQIDLCTPLPLRNLKAEHIFLD
jgi:hypothetical protein